MKTAKHPLYPIWSNMKSRCHNSSIRAYKFYGARGIRVCTRWRESFWNFVQDVGDRPSPEHTLDRYPDPDGNYEPGNVRWATWAEQGANRSGYDNYNVDPFELGALDGRAA